MAHLFLFLAPLNAMSEEKLADNPFTALFPSVSHAEEYVATYKSQVNQVQGKWEQHRWV